MPSQIRVLIVEDLESDAELMVGELLRHGFAPDWQRVEHEADYLARLQAVPDIILSDYHLPHFSGMRALSLLVERGADIPFIAVSGNITDEQAAELIKQGAADFLLKDRMARLGPAVAQALQQKRARDERRRLEQALREYTERLRRMSHRLFEVEESERRRLARELHDRIGQNVTALSLNLNMVRGELPADCLRNVGTHLDDCETLLFSTAQLVRDVMADLRPPGLDELGLLAALTEHARQVAGRSRLSVTVTGTEITPRLPPTTEIMLFRIAQEALVNVAKHAGASEVTMCLEATHDTVVMTIADNGLGFDTTARLVQPTSSLGMVTMRERAESFGGRLRVESAPGRGTRVIVEAPRVARSAM